MYDKERLKLGNNPDDATIKLILAAFDQTEEGIAIFDTEGNILHLNNAFAEMHGYTNEELTGLNHSFLHLPEHMTSVLEANKQVLKTGSFSGEILHLHRNGSVFTAYMRNTLVTDANGFPEALVGTFSDIPFAVQQIEEDDRAHHMLSSVLNAIPDVIGIQDPDHTMIRYNAAGYAMLGITPDDIDGKKCYEFIGRTVPCAKCATSTVYKTLKPARIEKYMSDWGVWLEVRAYPILDKSGKLVKVIEHLRDITMAKEADSRSRKLEEQIKITQKLESLGVMAGGIAHDFNNILMTVLGSADLAIREVKDNENLNVLLQDIIGASRRATELAGQMLDYSGRRESHRLPVNMNQIIRETTHMLEVTVSRKTKLEYHLSNDLPSIHADPTQVRQIAMNLLTNASEALEEHTGVVTISTSTSYCTKEFLSDTYLDDNLPEGDYALLTVTDSGSGMSMETIERIFDPFFTTKFTGRGLGLAAVLGIVRSHLGAVRIKSEPGHGSTISIYFPVCDEAETIEESQTVSDSDGTGCILVVDDEDAVREVTGKMLEKAGYSTVYACNGREALEFFKEKPHGLNCVILDLTMPVMDGIEAYDRITELAPDLPIIISSGFSRDRIMRKFTGKDIAGVLHKPCSIDEISSTVKQAIHDSCRKGRLQ